MSLDSVEALKLAVYIANKEFVKGFVVGQVFLCVLIFFLAKTFLFKNGQETRLEFNNSVKFAAKVRWLIQKSEERAAVLQKLRYQDSQSESLDWINVVIVFKLLYRATFLPICVETRIFWIRRLRGSMQASKTLDQVSLLNWP